jgi:hypothetical protein
MNALLVLTPHLVVVDVLDVEVVETFDDDVGFNELAVVLWTVLLVFPRLEVDDWEEVNRAYEVDQVEAAAEVVV